MNKEKFDQVLSGAGFEKFFGSMPRPLEISQSEARKRGFAANFLARAYTTHIWYYIIDIRLNDNDYAAAREVPFDHFPRLMDR